MLAKIIKAVLEWLTGLVRQEIKQDVKATDANTPDEVVDNFRAGMRDKLRNHKSGVRTRGEGRSETRPESDG
jgi:hypothetical protein